MSDRYQKVVDKAHVHVRKLLGQLPKHIRFHDLAHTLTVTRTAVGIGQALRVNTHDLLLLELAALFHDTGYTTTYEGHEAVSAELAAAFLRQGRGSAAGYRPCPRADHEHPFRSGSPQLAATDPARCGFVQGGSDRFRGMERAAAAGAGNMCAAQGSRNATG